MGWRWEAWWLLQYFPIQRNAHHLHSVRFRRKCTLAVDKSKKVGGWEDSESLRTHRANLALIYPYVAGHLQQLKWVHWHIVSVDWSIEARRTERVGEGWRTYRAFSCFTDMKSCWPPPHIRWLGLNRKRVNEFERLEDQPGQPLTKTSIPTFWTPPASKNSPV